MLLPSCWCTRLQNLSYLSPLNIGLGLSVSLVRQCFSCGISEVTHVQGGADVKENGALNAGLLDQVRNILIHQLLPIANPILFQRGALRWVQRYIHLFGGDKRWHPIPLLRTSGPTTLQQHSQVTIWGQSAGAGSTFFQVWHFLIDITIQVHEWR